MGEVFKLVFAVAMTLPDSTPSDASSGPSLTPAAVRYDGARESQGFQEKGASGVETLGVRPPCRGSLSFSMIHISSGAREAEVPDGEVGQDAGARARPAHSTTGATYDSRWCLRVGVNWCLGEDNRECFVKSQDTCEYV